MPSTELRGRSKCPREELPQFLASRGVRMATLIDQVEAEIGWIKTVNRLEGSRIQIGEDEIDAEMARVRQNAGAPEFRVADIFLPVDSPEERRRRSDSSRSGCWVSSPRARASHRWHVTSRRPPRRHGR